MAVTIEDVAKRAGVSAATVSRVINKSAFVRLETQERVREAIKELDYYLNVFARGLSRNKANIIGLIFPPSPQLASASFYKEILYGITTTANAGGYNILLNVEQSGDLKKDYSRLFVQRQVDGLIIVAMPPHLLAKAGIEGNKMPLVLLNTVLKKASFVDVDNVRGGFEATRHLVNLGHRSIGFINGVAASSNARDRFKGYRQALEEYNIPFKKSLVAAGDFNLYKGYEAMKSLLDINNPPSAVFCANDLMAIGAIQAVIERGLSVPEDVAMVGFDDIDAANYITPPLTTVRQPIFELGKTAVESLLTLINEQPEKPVQKILKVNLIVRESCGSKKG